MAETYHIYDFNALPVETLAALSFGLPEDSRIHAKMYGFSRISNMRMLASIADDLARIRYSLTSGEGTPEPYLFQKDMYANIKPIRKQVYKFASSEEFKEIWSNS